MHFGRPGPWAGLDKGIRLKISRTAYSTPHADSGFAAIPPTRPATVSKKAAFSGPQHPVTGSPIDAEKALRW
jgi:hypothetical protein